MKTFIFSYSENFHLNLTLPRNNDVQLCEQKEIIIDLLFSMKEKQVFYTACS